MRRFHTIVGVLLLAVLGAACGKADVSSPGTGGDREPDALVLRVYTEGGFVPEEFNLGNMPEFSLVGDGRVFTLGAQIEIYPPPALPPMLQRTIDDEAVGKIIAEATAAGLDGPDREYRYDLVADAGTTVFVYVDADGKTHTIRAYALGFESDGGDAPPGQTADEREARAKLAKLREKLLDLSSWLPQGSLGEDKPADIEKIRVFASAYAEADGDESVPQQAKAWPLGTPLGAFGAAHGDRWRCGVVEGADLDTALPEFRSSNTRTPWTSEQKRYQLVLRPLLPDETGCPS